MDYDSELKNLEYPDCDDCTEEVNLIMSMRQPLDQTSDFRVNPTQLRELMEASANQPEKNTLYLKLSILSLMIVLIISSLIFFRPEANSNKTNQPDLVNLSDTKNEKLVEENQLKNKPGFETKKKSKRNRRSLFVKSKLRKRSSKLSKRFVRLNSKLKSYKKTDKKRRMT